MTKKGGGYTIVYNRKVGKLIGKLLKNNYKFLIGILLGILATATLTYAASISAGNVTYDNTQSGIEADNVNEAINKLYEKASSKGGGNGKIGMEYTPSSGCTAPTLNEGDYVSIKPSASSFTIAPSLTGYTTIQTIKPNELTLWRVIKKNDCNVEVVSEYVSSTNVFFQGIAGYRNFVGTLNILASAYENPSYTVGSRMMGYDGQTEFISDTSAFDGSTNDPPALSPTSDPTSGTGQEFSGGVLGDTLYLKDYQLVGDVYKSDTSTYGKYGLKAYKVRTSTATDYWVASRKYQSDGTTTNYYYQGRFVLGNNGTLYSNDGFRARLYNGSWGGGSTSKALRPILTLKSGISVSGGSGTMADPYTLS